MTDLPPETPAPPAPPPRRSRWVPVALALSLAVNLLIAGIVVGSVWSNKGGRDGADPEARRVANGFGPFVAALSREDKIAARRSIRDRAPELAQQRRAEREQVERFIAILRSDPFEPEALGRLFEAQRRRAVDRVAIGQEVLLGRIAEMSPGARREFADRLEGEIRRARRNR